MSTHTPGPWRCKVALKIGDYWGAGSAHEVVAKANKDKWAGYVTGVLASSPNSESNARLIAAAPDMLAALRDLRDDIANLKWGQSYPGRNHGLMDRVDAVIAKATGDA